MPRTSAQDRETTAQQAELRQRADQLEAEGEREQAITVYEQLVGLAPGDSMPLLKLGDLHLKLEHFAEAVSAYGRAADTYRRDGAHDKALAVYTQMRALIRRHAKHLEPRHADLPLRLAEAHAALGQREEAARLFGEVVGPLAASGQAREALAIVAQMKALDRHSPTAHLLEADCHAKLGDTDQALTSAGAAADALVAQGKLAEAIAVLERLLAYRPDPAYARVIGRLYLARGQPGDAVAALQKLQICFGADPSDLPTLELLAAAFEAMDQPGRAARVLEEAVGAAEAQGREDELERLARKLLERDPESAVARAHVDRLGAAESDSRRFTDAEAEWGMRQLEEEITSVVGRKGLLRQAAASHDSLDSGLLALEEEITGVLARRPPSAAPRVDEEVLWQADGLAIRGRFDDAWALLEDQDPDHPLVREVRQRVADAELGATAADVRGALHSLYPHTEQPPAAPQEDDTAVFTRTGATDGADRAPAPAGRSDRNAEPSGPHAPPPGGHRRPALSGAISRRRRRTRR